MQPCDRTVAQNCSKIAQDLGFERKNDQFTTVLSFWVIFLFFILAFGPFCCAKHLNRNIGRAKKFAFRKSASSICHLCHWGLSCPVGYVERGGCLVFNLTYYGV